MNQNTMNNPINSRPASFQNRSVRAASFLRVRPARFTVEDESEGIELFLRGLLILSLIVALTICNAYLTAGHGQPSALPTHNTAVACTQDVVAPAAEAL